MICLFELVAGVQLFVPLPVVLGVVVLECECELSVDGVERIVGLHWHLVHHVVVIVVELSWILLSWRGNGLYGIQELTC